MKKLIVLCLIAAVSLSFAGKKETKKEIAAVKKIADSAIAATEEIKKTLSDVQNAQREITRAQERFALMLDDVSPTRLEEAEISMAYLTEAFRDLYSQVKSIQLIPIIQQAQKPLSRPAGFSVSLASNKLLGGDEFAIYSRGLDSFRKKFFDESRQIMKELINTYPNGTYLDRAYFWMAESYFMEKNYSTALPLYQKVLNFSGSSKEDDAQYKTAACYSLLNEPDKAFEEYKKLTQRYPASDFVPRANEALREISERRNAKTAVAE
jgi:TolA-binding protein